MYYLRTKAATDAIKFTLDKSKLAVPAAAEVMQEPVLTGPTTTGPVSVEMAAQRAATISTKAMTAEERAAAEIACSLDNPDSCEMCSG
jgi:ribonucleoside-diphosphate reductase alpha chain